MVFRWQDIRHEALWGRSGMKQNVREQPHGEREAVEVSRGQAPVVPEVLPLAAVLRQIQRDSHTAPAQYLDETEVEYGGE